MDSSDGLNVGDVTGPRWAGGTRNPDAIDSSNAEKAWWDTNRLGMLPPDQVAARRSDFRAGRVSRDAEVATLREQLAAAEARAVHAELEWAEADARTVLAEAVIEAAGEAIKRMDVLEGSQSYGVRLPYGEIETVQKVLNAYRTGDTNA